MRYISIMQIQLHSRVFIYSFLLIFTEIFSSGHNLCWLCNMTNCLLPKLRNLCLQMENSGIEQRFQSPRHSRGLSENSRTMRWRDPIRKFLEELKNKGMLPQDLNAKLRSNYSVILESSPTRKFDINRSGMVIDKLQSDVRNIPKILNGKIINLTQRVSPAGMLTRMGTWIENLLNPIGSGEMFAIEVPIDSNNSANPNVNLLRQDTTAVKRVRQTNPAVNSDLHVTPIKGVSFANQKSPDLTSNSSNLNNHNVEENPVTLYNIPNVVPGNQMLNPDGALSRYASAHALSHVYLDLESGRSFNWNVERNRIHRTANSQNIFDLKKSGGSDSERSDYPILPVADRWTDSLSWIHNVPKTLRLNHTSGSLGSFHKLPRVFFKSEEETNGGNVHIDNTNVTNILEGSKTYFDSTEKEFASPTTPPMPSIPANVSQLIWSDLTREEYPKLSKQSLYDDNSSLADDLSALGSQLIYRSSENGNTKPSFNLTDRLWKLQQRIDRMPSDNAIEVLVQAGSRLIDRQLAAVAAVPQRTPSYSGYGERRRDEPLCRCPKSKITPGVLAGLTSLLALLIYVASVATLAVSGNTGSVSASSSANATGRMFPDQITSTDRVLVLGDIADFWLQKSISLTYGSYVLRIRNLSLLYSQLIDYFGLLLSNRALRTEGRALSQNQWQINSLKSMLDGHWLKSLVDWLFANHSETIARTMSEDHFRLLEESGIRVNVRPSENSRPKVKDGADLSWDVMYDNVGVRKVPSAPRRLWRFDYNRENTASVHNSTSMISEKTGLASITENKSGKSGIDSSPNTRTSYNTKFRHDRKRAHSNKLPINSKNNSNRNNFLGRKSSPKALRPKFHNRKRVGHRSRKPVMWLFRKLLGMKPRRRAVSMGQRLVDITRRIAPSARKNDRKIGVGQRWLRRPVKTSFNQRRLGPRHLNENRSMAIKYKKQTINGVNSDGRISESPRSISTRSNSTLANRNILERIIRNKSIKTLWNRTLHWLANVKTLLLNKRVEIKKTQFNKNPTGDIVEMKYPTYMNRPRGSQEGKFQVNKKIEDGIERKAKPRAHSNRLSPKQKKVVRPVQFEVLRRPFSTVDKTLSKPAGKKISRRSKYKKIMCDCKSNLGDILGFLPLAILVGYSTTVSTAAASAAASGSSGSTGTSGSVTVTINDADTTTIANTNSPSLSNTDSDVITVAANANPVNTNTNTLTNNDNDVISNTNTATSGRSWIRALATDPVLALLLDLLKIKDTHSEECFKHQLCSNVANAALNPSLIRTMSAPVSLLLVNHRRERGESAASQAVYQEAFNRGIQHQCHLYRCMLH